MNNVFLRRAGIAFRLVFPTMAERRYARKMRESGLFDRQFYLSANPNIHPFSARFPEMHYIQRGEPAGLRPNPDFAPFAYLRHNADLTDKVVHPLLHYIDFGQFEQRVTKDLPVADEFAETPLPVLRRAADAPDPAPYAVVVHVYYHDLWDEIAEVLRRQRFEFDLFVSVVQFKKKSDLSERIRREFPQARVYDIPNHGRDIFPFVHLVNSGLLRPYRAVCKIHTKKSPHRQDGDVWRSHLINGILGDPEKTIQRLQHFLDRRDAAFWVADGQFYAGEEWWGSNKERVTALLQRVELQPDLSDLSFPAGSMYWVKPLMLDMIRGMRLTFHDFDQELAQVDGTIAHAMERALGYMSKAAGQTTLQTTELDKPAKHPARTAPRYVSAFYLPQFHPVPENDLWWGRGFTEWTNVVHSRAAYPGHCQPALPGDLGFYDLRVPDTLAAQARMARGAGVDAFCVYHYWFDGRRILERPMQTVLDTPDLDFPFYLCWANESWRRNWDGMTGEVLLDQSYRDGFATQLAQDMLPYFRDARYARPDGTRPRFIIYRPEDMPDPAASVDEMRQTWHEAGIGEVELGAVRFHVEGAHPVADDLFDFWVEMPPHGSVGADEYLWGGPQGNRLNMAPVPGFEGLIYDYRAVARKSLGKAHVKTLPANTIAGVMPSWDNTARRGLGAHIAYGASPATFANWLEGMAKHRIAGSYRQELFVNAWNEWAEKAVLEPTEQYGDANLRVLAALCTDQASAGRKGQAA
jgi:lipopolysaccharide biosynthesis protein